MKIPFGTLALVGAALLVGVGVLAYAMPSDDYLYVPNTARPVAEKVSVGGEDKADDRGGIYTSTSRCARRRWAERYLPFLRPEGATLVPGHAILARGQTFEDRRVKALRGDGALGAGRRGRGAARRADYDVKATPRGVLVDGGRRPTSRPQACSRRVT